MEPGISLKATLPYYDKTMHRHIDVEDGDRMMLKFKAPSKRILVRTLRSAYPTLDDLAALCTRLYTYGINYRNVVYLTTPDEDDADE